MKPLMNISCILVIYFILVSADHHDVNNDSERVERIARDVSDLAGSMDKLLGKSEFGEGTNGAEDSRRVLGEEGGHMGAVDSAVGVGETNGVGRRISSRRSAGTNDEVAKRSPESFPSGERIPRRSRQQYIKPTGKDSARVFKNRYAQPANAPTNSASSFVGLAAMGAAEALGGDKKAAAPPPPPAGGMAGGCGAAAPQQMDPCLKRLFMKQMVQQMQQSRMAQAQRVPQLNVFAPNPSNAGLRVAQMKHEVNILNGDVHHMQRVLMNVRNGIQSESSQRHLNNEFVRADQTRLGQEIGGLNMEENQLQSEEKAMETEAEDDLASSTPATPAPAGSPTPPTGAPTPAGPQVNPIAPAHPLMGTAPTSPPIPPQRAMQPAAEAEGEGEAEGAGKKTQSGKKTAPAEPEDKPPAGGKKEKSGDVKSSGKKETTSGGTSGSSPAVKGAPKANAKKTGAKAGSTATRKFASLEFNEVPKRRYTPKRKRAPQTSHAITEEEPNFDSADRWEEGIESAVDAEASGDISEGEAEAEGGYSTYYGPAYE